MKPRTRRSRRKTRLKPNPRQRRKTPSLNLASRLRGQLLIVSKLMWKALPERNEHERTTVERQKPSGGPRKWM